MAAAALLDFENCYHFFTIWSIIAKFGVNATTSI